MSARALRAVVVVATIALPACAPRAQVGSPPRPPPAPSTSAVLPRVHLIATGGTISNTGGARLTAEDFIARIPELASVARITSEQFSNVASGEITTEMLRRLAARVRAVVAGDDPARGVVVTHGTDTMEETAYFLSLTVGICTPVIVTGAMRNAAQVGPDGPANLYNSVRVIAAPESRGYGAMVLLNDLAFAARDVTKANTTRVDTFEAPDGAPLAIADPDAVIFRAPGLLPGTPCPPPRFDLDALGAIPRVDVVYSYIDADSVAIDAAVNAGARGIVLAGVGRGGSTPGQSRALQRAVDRGVFVAISNRTGSGSVGAETGLGDWKAGQGAFISARFLNPQKARILLMLALARTSDAHVIDAYFRAP